MHRWLSICVRIDAVRCVGFASIEVDMSPRPNRPLTIQCSVSVILSAWNTYRRNPRGYLRDDTFRSYPYRGGRIMPGRIREPHRLAEVSDMRSAVRSQKVSLTRSNYRFSPFHWSPGRSRNNGALPFIINLPGRYCRIVDISP
jgi:hypothetical protein